jgi:hypothetical protein
MSRYSRSQDPYWLTAKFESKCTHKGCGATIKKGERAFYYPSSRSCYCQKDDCGGQASRDFESAKNDDAGTCGY